MIVSRIRCGLGNQMFQYATGYALAKRAGLPFRLDTSWYRETDADRDFMLNNWATPTPEAKTMYPLVEEERSMFYSPLAPKPSHLVGYWLSELYFIDARANLLELFRPRVPQPAPVFDVGIHVRRAEPLGSRFLDIATRDYYAKAVEAFRRYLPDPSFAVWSDAPNYAADIFPPTFHIQPMGHPVHDLYAMSQCRHQIIANSTFSWWAAWLNQNPSKRIIWPKRLTKSYPPVAQTDYIPDSWQQP